MSQEPHLNSLSDDQFYGTSDFLSVGKYYENRKVATKKKKRKKAVTFLRLSFPDCDW